MYYFVMNVDEQEFVSLCSDVMEMVESFDDKILGPSEEASFNSLDEFSVDLVRQHGESFVFGIECGRKGLVYSIIGSPTYDYFEVSFVHTLTQQLIKQVAMTDEEQEQLSETQQENRIDNTSISSKEIGQLLSQNRMKPLDKIDSKVYNELGSQTGCSFRITKTDTGDIVAIESLQKIFVEDDDFTRSDFEQAIVAVTNVGKSSIFLLSQMYDIGAITPKSISKARESLDRNDTSKHVN